MKKLVIIGVIVLVVALFVGVLGGNSDSGTSSGNPDTGSSQTGSGGNSQSSSGGSGSSNKATVGESNALRSAKNYLRTMPFSKKGLQKQLEFEGYSESEALYAVNNCGANWKEQAVKEAKNYLDIMPFSKQELITLPFWI